MDDWKENYIESRRKRTKVDHKERDMEMNRSWKGKGVCLLQG